MTKIKFLAIILAILAPTLLFIENRKLKEQNVIAQNNVCTLLDSVAHYKTANNLNAAQVQELILEKAQYEKYRAEDAALIKQLKADKVKEVVKTITETYTEVFTQFDTIYVDSTKHFCYDDKWTKVDGLVYKDSVKLNITNTEELMIVESIQRKKFWFIKLPIKLFGYKHKLIDVISKNPHTQIKSTEFVTFK